MNSFKEGGSNVACRPTARKGLQKKQLYNSFTNKLICMATIGNCNCCTGNKQKSYNIMGINMFTP
jgi:hypothetical protein